ncbi:MAG: Gfo/Idh/MocA family protein, partial [Ilumatobacteraceae bacterium]
MTSDHPVRVGIVGPGWWSETMFIPAVRSFNDAELVAICGRNLERTTHFARMNAIPLVFTDPVEMFQSGTIDAVIISTSNNSHHPLTMAALDNGLHVLCEKPLEMNPAQADEMLRYENEMNETCLVPFTY